MMEDHRDHPEADYTALGGLLWTLPTIGRSTDAQQLADEALSTAHRTRTPMWIAWAMAGRGRAYGQTDPDVALEAIRAASAYAREERLPFYEALNARESAEIEALRGDFDQGLVMYESTLEELHRAGAAAQLAITIASVAAFFTRFDHVEAAATLIGAAMANAGTVDMAIDVDGTVDLLVEKLGRDRYDELTADGSRMNLTGAVQFAINHIAGLRNFTPD